MSDFAIRSKMFWDILKASDDAQELQGWQKASVRRLVNSHSSTLGVPPQDAYASGLTDLSVLASFLPAPVERDRTAPQIGRRVEFEFWNVEVLPGDEILFAGGVYEVEKVLSRTPSLVLGQVVEREGSAVFEEITQPAAPVCVMFVVFTKPKAEVWLRLRFVDREGETVLSDQVWFSAGCKVGDYCVVTRDRAKAVVSQAVGIEDFAGELGAGVIKLLDDCPFRLRVLAAQKGRMGE